MSTFAVMFCSLFRVDCDNGFDGVLEGRPSRPWQILFSQESLKHSFCNAIMLKSSCGCCLFILKFSNESAVRL